MQTVRETLSQHLDRDYQSPWLGQMLRFARLLFAGGVFHCRLYQLRSIYYAEEKTTLSKGVYCTHTLLLPLYSIEIKKTNKRNDCNAQFSIAKKKITLFIYYSISCWSFFFFHSLTLVNALYALLYISYCIWENVKCFFSSFSFVVCVCVDERGHVCECVWHFYSVFQSKLQHSDSEWVFEVSVLDLQTTAISNICFSRADIKRNTSLKAQTNENMAIN